MSDIDTVIEAITLGATGGALLLFLVGTATRRQPAPPSETDFGVVFGAFLAAWLAAEVVEVLAPPGLLEAAAVAHFLMLAAVAVWLLARFRSALRRAKGGA
jgi:hypothetical protein